MSFSALVVGESLTDIVVRAQGTREFPGGSPMNVAIGLARLGADVQLHTSFGHDERGVAIKSHLAQSNVRLTPESITDAVTSVAKATIDEVGAASYAFDLSSELHALPTPPSVDIVHTGSIGAALEPGAAHVRGIVNAARHRSTITFDPNVRPSMMGRRDEVAVRVAELVSQSDVVKASDEDLRWLSPDVDPRETAGIWAHMGPAIVVVTHGEGGADGFAGSSLVHVAASNVNVVDTIGAGDSFMAGLIIALGDRNLLGAAKRAALAEIDTATLGAVVSFAATCAAFTVSRQGANPPMRADLLPILSVSS
jgi:fructokinase